MTDRKCYLQLGLPESGTRTGPLYLGLVGTVHSHPGKHASYNQRPGRVSGLRVEAKAVQKHTRFKLLA